MLNGLFWLALTLPLAALAIVSVAVDQLNFGKIKLRMDIRGLGCLGLVAIAALTAGGIFLLGTASLVIF